MRGILRKFETTANFWFPTLTHKLLWNMRSDLSSDDATQDDAETCLALLTMALGCAAEVTAGLLDKTDLNEDEQDSRRESKALGDMFFDAALQRLYAAHANVNATAAHCLLFAA